jgi:hypothetical protein
MTERTAFDEQMTKMRTAYHRADEAKKDLVMDAIEAIYKHITGAELPEHNRERIWYELP